MRPGNNVATRYATEMFCKSIGLPDLPSVMKAIEKEKGKRPVKGGRSCMFCGRDDVGVYYSSPLSSSFGDYMSLKDQASSTICPWCMYAMFTWMILMPDGDPKKAIKLLTAPGIIVWEDVDKDTGISSYHHRIELGKDKLARALEAGIGGNVVIDRAEFREHALNPRGNYFAIVRNRSGLGAGKSTHTLGGAVVNARGEKYLLTAMRSRRSYVLMEPDFLKKFLAIKNQISLAATKKKDKDVYLGHLRGLDEFLEGSWGRSNGNGSQPVPADPWNGLPERHTRLAPFKPIWPKVVESWPALEVLYKLL